MIVLKRALSGRLNKMVKVKYRKAVFIVVYSLDSNNLVKYLILRRKKHWKGWEFPKGGIDAQDFFIKRRSARREVFEETGQKPIRGSLKRYNKSGKYFYPKQHKDRPGVIGQTYSLFSAKIPLTNEIRIDKKEHSSWKWVGYNEARKILTWENQKESLEKVHAYLKKKLKK
jgi:8-oxo-dGTP pyrophosphatase MutT (NUDIX family)